MKSLKIISLCLIFISGFISAQKIGVVDTDYILSQLPQFKDAEQRMNSQVEQWKKEVQDMQSDYEKKKSALENERVLLVGDQLKQREKEVDDLDKKIKNIINSRFGPKGEINNARANLAKPFQDQIWNAIKTISEKNSLGIVLDKSNNISVIFLEKRYDYTDKVLNLLLKNQPEKTGKGSNAKTGKTSNVKKGGKTQNRGNTVSGKKGSQSQNDANRNETTRFNVKDNSK